MRFNPVPMLATCIALFATHLQAGVIVNGNFERPQISGYVTFSQADPLQGWEVAVGTVDVINSSGGAYDGTQYLDIDGTPGPGAIQQSFATVVGSTYTLSFAYRRSGKSATASVVDGMGSLLEINLNGTNDWIHSSINFVAREAETTLRFTSASSKSNDGLFLDAIDVVSATSTVPEPASLALLGLGGIGLVGGAWRKRRSSRVVG